MILIMKQSYDSYHLMVDELKVQAYGIKSLSLINFIITGE